MHRIIALWCHPRSMSTAIERLIRERGDLQCLHEPFMYDYYLSQAKRDMPYFTPAPDQPTSYAAVRDMILKKAESTPVFLKDMSYYVVNYLAQDFAFHQRLTNCFLIRNPKAAIASYYQLDPEVTLEEIGFEAQWRHYCYLTELGLQCTVIQAESIRRDTRRAVGEWWSAIGLSFVENAFEWSDQPPKDWQQVEQWHASSIASCAIKKYCDGDAEAEQMRFDRALREAPHLQNYLDHHQIYYARLAEQAR